jgi:hypothetical protein
MENQPGLDGPVLTSTSCQDGLIRSRWQQTLSLNPSVDVHSAKNNSVDVHHLFFMSWDASWVFPMIFWDLIIPCVLGVQPLQKHQPTRALAATADVTRFIQTRDEHIPRLPVALLVLLLA